jgi:hypothetical protein
VAASLFHGSRNLAQIEQVLDKFTYGGVVLFQPKCPQAIRFRIAVVWAYLVCVIDCCTREIVG